MEGWQLFVRVFRFFAPPASHMVLRVGLLMCLGLLWFRLAADAGRSAQFIAGGTETVDFAEVALVLILAAIASASQSLLNTHLNMTVEQSARNRLFERYAFSELAVDPRATSGDISNYFLQDTQIVAGFFSSAIPALVPHILICTTALVLMSHVHAGLAAGAALFVVILLSSVIGMYRLMRPLAGQQAKARAELTSELQVQIALAPSNRVFNRAKWAVERMTAKSAQLFDLSWQVITKTTFVQPIAWLSAAGALWVLIETVSIEGWSGPDTAGRLVEFSAYALILLRSAMGIVATLGGATTAYGSVQRIAQLLDVSIVEDGDKHLSQAVEELRFEGVEYRYPSERDHTALVEVSATIHRGEIVVISGPNGSGKSTLVRLLTRLSAPSEGSLTVNGIPIEQVAFGGHRNVVAWVPQTVGVLPDNIAANIKMGAPNATEADIEQAARQVGLGKLLDGGAHTLHSLVGENGSRLSGGERQRVALARAIVSNPDILVLDEAMSMIDPDSEYALWNELCPWFRQRIVIAISHRAQTLEFADRHFVLDSGYLKEMA